MLIPNDRALKDVLCTNDPLGTKPDVKLLAINAKQAKISQILRVVSFVIVMDLQNV